ncbi:MAG TPA: methylated-DNA--[protein]-cysteine S-methyltransferase [Syntrophobacteraceae bacterium]|nr:methylated-DNA--[protein]-cysteine S-methyltransferase [Syntrophobacteraceae bacterium]
MIREEEQGPISYTTFPSPCGRILLAANERGICRLHFFGAVGPRKSEIQKILHLPSIGGEDRGSSAVESLLCRARESVCGYLQEGNPLEEFPLDLSSGTDFQRRVWQCLGRIPRGQTRTYLEVAAQMGSPRASRAVGQACGRNPVALFVPCHRVVGAGGKLGGFSGGIEVKRNLLELESGSGNCHSRMEDKR